MGKEKNTIKVILLSINKVILFNISKLIRKRQDLYVFLLLSIIRVILYSTNKVILSNTTKVILLLSCCTLLELWKAGIGKFCVVFLAEGFLSVRKLVSN